MVMAKQLMQEQKQVSLTPTGTAPWTGQPNNLHPPKDWKLWRSALANLVEMENLRAPLGDWITADYHQPQWWAINLITNTVYHCHHSIWTLFHPITQGTWMWAQQQHFYLEPGCACNHPTDIHLYQATWHHDISLHDNMFQVSYAKPGTFLTWPPQTMMVTLLSTRVSDVMENYCKDKLDHYNAWHYILTQKQT